MSRHILFWAFLTLAGLSLVWKHDAEAGTQKDEKSKRKIEKVLTKKSETKNDASKGAKDSKKKQEVWCCDRERGKIYKTTVAKCEKENAYGSRNEAKKACKKEAVWCCNPITGKVSRVSKARCSQKNSYGSEKAAREACEVWCCNPLTGKVSKVSKARCSQKNAFESEDDARKECRRVEEENTETGLEESGTGVEGMICSSDLQCAALDEPSSCFDVATCMGRRVEGRCISNQCRAVEIPDYAVCEGSICSAGSCDYERLDSGYWTAPRACDAIGRCEPVAESGPCDDGNPCTEDSCLESMGCRNEPVDGEVPCYFGEPDTRGVGACRDGFIQCYGGSPGDSCLGQRLPSAEDCYDTVDNDCDGEVNEEGALRCTYYRRDRDGDGFGLADDTRCLCEPAGIYTAPATGIPDCDDISAMVNPAMTESCGSPYDDNCIGGANEEGADGCTTYYRDADGDGFGRADEGRCLCAPEAPHLVENANDCVDSMADINPGAAELCDGRDNDCDGLVDTADEPLAALCPSVPNAYEECAGILGCRIAYCSGSWHDVNEAYADGCEIEKDWYDRHNQGGGAAREP